MRRNVMKVMKAVEHGQKNIRIQKYENGRSRKMMDRCDMMNMLENDEPSNDRA